MRTSGFGRRHVLCLLLLFNICFEVMAAKGGKCLGRWAIHACHGGNGKRSQSDSQRSRPGSMELDRHPLGTYPNYGEQEDLSSTDEENSMASNNDNDKHNNDDNNANMSSKDETKNLFSSIILSGMLNNGVADEFDGNRRHEMKKVWIKESKNQRTRQEPTDETGIKERDWIPMEIDRDRRFI